MKTWGLYIRVKETSFMYFEGAELTKKYQE